MADRVNDSVIVSVSFTDGQPGVMIVGKPGKKGEGIGIVNAFEGDEAKKLWATLTIKKGEPRCL